MIKVCIADDHAIVREGLKQMLADIPDIIVAGEASTGQEVLDKVQSGQWDVLVLDLSLPDRNGLDILKQLKSEYKAPPVLVLTVHSEEQYAIRVLRAGASGYLTKDSASDQLITAIRKVAGGGKYVSPSLVEKLLFNYGGISSSFAHRNLSDRELQVLSLVAAGKTLTQIAELLRVSVKTVSTYRRRILQKMGMQNTAELIHYAIEHRLVW
jgi:DNA-binding NarL/FixJ family response regulator